MDRKVIAKLAIISVLVVVLSPLFTPVTVTNTSQLRDLRFGAPLKFIVQDSSLTPPDDWFPRKLTLQSPWESVTRILWGNFACSAAIVAAGLVAAYGVLTLIRRAAST